MKISSECLPHFWTHFHTLLWSLHYHVLDHQSLCLQGIVLQATLFRNGIVFTREICLHMKHGVYKTDVKHYSVFKNYNKNYNK
jgi:hypothetical protein